MKFIFRSFFRKNDGAIGEKVKKAAEVKPTVEVLATK